MGDPRLAWVALFRSGPGREIVRFEDGEERIGSLPLLEKIPIDRSPVDSVQKGRKSPDMVEETIHGPIGEVLVQHFQGPSTVLQHEDFACGLAQSPEGHSARRAVAANRFDQSPTDSIEYGLDPGILSTKPGAKIARGPRACRGGQAAPASALLDEILPHGRDVLGRGRKDVLSFGDSGRRLGGKVQPDHVKYRDGRFEARSGRGSLGEAGPASGLSCGMGAIGDESDPLTSKVGRVDW